MRIFNKSTLRAFEIKYPDAEEALGMWWKVALEANWTKAADVKSAYGNASILGNDHVVFNICGNKYRLIVQIRYQFHAIYIRWFGTHEDYDEIDAEAV